MRIEVAINLLIILLAILALPPGAAGEDTVEAGGITIWADSLSYDQKSNTYQAAGNVMMVWNGAILVAESATLNEAENEAEASGKVRLVKGGEVLNCDRIKVNLLTEKGEVFNGDLFSRKSNFHIKGERFVRLGEDSYRLEHGTFTACDGDNPSWRFTADNLDVNLEDFAVGTSAIFYIGDIPSFYTPYILFPVQRERQSGFLFPKIGNSNMKGFNVDIPYYWAISPSQEATFDLDIQSKRGAGLGVDYEYKRQSDSLGKIYGYTIFDTSQNRLRGNLVAQQQEWFTPSLVFKSDIDLVSDRTFFQDFSEENGQYNRQITDSSASLTKNWQNYSLAGEVRYVDDLQAQNNRLTFQKLPNVNFTAVRQKVPMIPLYLGLDSSFTNYYREDGIKGTRFGVHPLAELYLSAPAGLDLSAWAGYRERIYDNYGGASGNVFRSIGMFDAGATIATSLERVYETNWGALRKVRHTMVPELNYNFVETKNQDNLPFYDYNDRLLGHNMFGWAVTNFLTGKYQEGDASPTYRDLFYLKLSQGYQISGDSRDPVTGTPRDLLTLVDDGKRLTDIRIEANFSPIKEFSIFTDSRLSVYDTRYESQINRMNAYIESPTTYSTTNVLPYSHPSFAFNTIMAGFDFKDDTGNVAGISYRYSRELVEYVEGRLIFKLIKPFTFNYTVRWSLDSIANNQGVVVTRRGLLESLYSLEYKHQCWGVNLAYHDMRSLGNHAFTINFTLAGIGPLGKIKAF